MRANSPEGVHEPNERVAELAGLWNGTAISRRLDSAPNSRLDGNRPFLLTRHLGCSRTWHLESGDTMASLQAPSHSSTAD